MCIYKKIERGASASIKQPPANASRAMFAKIKLRNMRTNILPLAALLYYYFISAASSASLSTPPSQQKRENFGPWKAVRDSDLDRAKFGYSVDDRGAALSLNVSTPSWATIFDARVPGTAFVNLLENGTFDNAFSSRRNPYCDLDLANAPDISDVGPAFFTFWYIAEVTGTPQTAAAGRTWIDFDGVNYEGKVFFNGALVSALPQGMFHRTSVEVTRHWKKETANVVAILVQPPPVLGRPTKSCPPKNCGQGGDHGMARNGPIMQMTLGWDWIQSTPDRNTGIWSAISLEESLGAVRVRDAHAVLPDNNQVIEDGGKVSVEIRADLELVASEAAAVDIHVRIDGVGKTPAFGEASAGNDHAVSLRVSLVNASLWWPNGAGDAFLYNCTLTARVNGKVSDVAHFHFGLRTIELEYNAKTKGPQFVINGRPIFISGGNWIGIDQLLRLNETRYRNEVKLHAAMGFNMLRVWGGGIAERSAFYDACDRQGILVWQEFFMTGDNNGRWAGNYAWPDNHEVYISNAIDTIKARRGHPSLAIWVLGNELYPVARNPPRDIRDALASALEADRRPWRVSSMTNATQYDWKTSMAPKDGPYGLLDDAQFSERNPGLYYWHESKLTRAINVSISFQPELGSSSCPTYESLQSFLSPRALAEFPTNASAPVAASWAFHNYLPWSYSGSKNNSIENLGQRIPRNARDFADRAQLVQKRQLKLLFESFLRNMWVWYTGVLYWKSQSPWPALRGALYAFDLHPTGGFYGAAAALSSLVSVQLDTAEPRRFFVVNRGSEALRDVSILLEAYSLKNSSLVNRIESSLFDVVPSSSHRASQEWHWPLHAGGDDALLVRLTLRGGASAWNEYLFSNNRSLSFDLDGQRTALSVSLDGDAVVIKNTGHAVAVSVSLVLFKKGIAAIERNESKCREGKDDPRVEGFFFDDNYFHLLGGQSRRVAIRMLDAAVTPFSSSSPSSYDVAVRASALNAPDAIYSFSNNN